MTTNRDEIDNMWRTFFAQACREVPYHDGANPRWLAIKRQHVVVDNLIQEILDLRKKVQDNG